MVDMLAEVFKRVIYLTCKPKHELMAMRLAMVKVVILRRPSICSRCGDQVMKSTTHRSKRINDRSKATQVQDTVTTRCSQPYIGQKDHALLTKRIEESRSVKLHLIVWYDSHFSLHDSCLVLIIVFLS